MESLLTTLPGDLQRELNLYRYHRLSFLVNPSDAGENIVILSDFTIHAGYISTKFPELPTKWAQIMEFLDAQGKVNRLGISPWYSDDIGVWIKRVGGMLVLYCRIGSEYQPVLTFSPEAENDLVEKLRVLLWDYTHPTSPLYTQEDRVQY